MPLEGKTWRHIIISTYSSWLPGAPRGFRARNHKLHSSGDYKYPPPEGEHAGLHQYAKQVAGDKVVIPSDLRAAVGEAIRAKLAKLQHRVLVISVSATHAHLLVELPTNYREAREAITECKVAAAHAARPTLSGGIWARGGKYKLIEDAQHQRNTFNYILRQQDAWIWSFKQEPSPEEDAAEQAPPETQSAAPSGGETVRLPDYHSTHPVP